MQSFTNFKVPDEKVRQVAVGGIAGAPIKVKKALQVIIPFGKPIPKPGPSDWLWEHDEDGQTFDTYKSQPINYPDSTKKVIYIQPLEKTIDSTFVDNLKKVTEAFYYGMEVKLRRSWDLDNSDVESRTNEYTGKKQYHGGKILRALQGKLPKDAYCLIGICTTDLYPRDEWNFVFGLASLKDRTGVFSFARYDENFFADTGKPTDPLMMFYRSCKVMTHEIGHMFGMRHCIYFDCCMNGSNNLEENERRVFDMCPCCIRKLQHNIKFPFLERFEALAAVCNEFGGPFKEAAEYTGKVAELIRDAYGSNYTTPMQAGTDSTKSGKTEKK